MRIFILGLVAVTVWPRVALDIQTVGAQAQAAVRRVNAAFVRAGRLAPVRRPGL